jgi:hypothetical protein
VSVASPSASFVVRRPQPTTINPLPLRVYGARSIFHIFIRYVSLRVHTPSRACLALRFIALPCLLSLCFPTLRSFTCYGSVPSVFILLFCLTGQQTMSSKYCSCCIQKKTLSCFLKDALASPTSRVYSTCIECRAKNGKKRTALQALDPNTRPVPNIRPAKRARRSNTGPQPTIPARQPQDVPAPLP